MNREDTIMKLCEDSGFKVKDVDLEELEYGEICYLPLNGTFMDYVYLDEIDTSETDENIAELILKDIKTKR